MSIHLHRIEDYFGALTNKRIKPTKNQFQELSN